MNNQIRTILATAAFIVSAHLYTGCTPNKTCAPLPDGTEDCSPVVMHNELDGTWCNQRSPQVCLTVDSHSSSLAPQTSRYVLTIGLCTETGTLTGGLEFDPDTASRVCIPGFTHDLWSAASTTQTSYGIYLYDISQCQDSTCDDTTIAYTNDLDLSYMPGR